MITKTALIPRLKLGVHENRRFSVPKGKLSLRVFNRAVFGIENSRTKVRGIIPQLFSIKMHETVSPHHIW